MENRPEGSDPFPGLRARAEEAGARTKEKLERDFASLTREEGIRLLYELHVHQIELQMQNDELRRIQHELEVSHSRYIDLYDFAPVGYLTLDKQGIILEANLTAANLLELNRDTLISLPFTKFIAAESQDTWYFIQKRIIETATAPPSSVTRHEIAELRLAGKNARPFWVRIDTTAAQIADGTFVHRVTMSDITAEKHAAAENVRLEKESQKHQKLESLGSLAAGIAHDFNNLLAGVFGNIELAKMENKAENVGTYLQTALAALERSRALTGQLLTFAKGGLPTQTTGTLFPFIRNEIEQRVKKAGIPCTFTVPDTLYLCSFDKGQISQVVEGIINNAIDATPEGGTIHVLAQNILLTDRERGNLPAGKYVQLSVRDEGQGIQREILPHIFDPFFTTKSNNYGLGLAVCYSILKKHGGHIDAQVLPKTGTVFHVFLPAVAETHSAIPKKDAHKPAQKGTIVVMDDDETVRSMMSRLLVHLGYHAIGFKDGTETLDFIRSQMDTKPPITAMIFDLTIPGGMSGKETVAEIRKLGITTPIFVSSGYNDDPAMAAPEKFGFTASIPKPCRITDITDVLQKYCPA